MFQSIFKRKHLTTELTWRETAAKPAASNHASLITKSLFRAHVHWLVRRRFSFSRRLPLQLYSRATWFSPRPSLLSRLFEFTPNGARRLPTKPFDLNRLRGNENKFKFSNQLKQLQFPRCRSAGGERRSWRGAKPNTRNSEFKRQRDNKVAVSPSRPMICSTRLSKKN